MRKRRIDAQLQILARTQPLIQTASAVNTTSVRSEFQAPVRDGGVSRGIRPPRFRRLNLLSIQSILPSCLFFKRATREGAPIWAGAQHRVEARRTAEHNRYCASISAKLLPRVSRASNAAAKLMADTSATYTATAVAEPVWRNKAIAMIGAREPATMDVNW